MGEQTRTEEELREQLRRMIAQPERDVWAEMRIHRKLDD
jgi:hypothetical protein